MTISKEFERELDNIIKTGDCIKPDEPDEAKIAEMEEKFNKEN